METMIAPVSVLLVALAAHAPSAPPPAGAAQPVADVADATARFARAMLAHDVDGLVALTPAPFSFDGTSAKSVAEVREHWASLLDRHPLTGVRLYGIEVLPFAGMVQRYGPPPARLANLPLRQAMVGIANLGGHATLVLWRKRARGWQAFAVSD